VVKSDEVKYLFTTGRQDEVKMKGARSKKITHPVQPGSKLNSGYWPGIKKPDIAVHLSLPKFTIPNQPPSKYRYT
jgi:hypothetical protein